MLELRLRAFVESCSFIPFGPTKKKRPPLEERWSLIHQPLLDFHRAQAALFVLRHDEVLEPELIALWITDSREQFTDQLVEMLFTN